MKRTPHEAFLARHSILALLCFRAFCRGDVAAARSLRSRSSSEACGAADRAASLALPRIAKAEAFSGSREAPEGAHPVVAGGRGRRASCLARVVSKRWHPLLPLWSRMSCSVLMTVGDATLKQRGALHSGREESRTASKRVEESRKRPGTRIGESDVISAGCGTMIAWFPKPGVACSSHAGGAIFNENPSVYEFVARKGVSGERVYRGMIAAPEADTLFWISADTWICRSRAMRWFAAESVPAGRHLSFT